ncbi:DUF1150 family protein [Rhodovulum sulfidophilum]|uniref:Conserved domain protein n=1 Tax=Rhodovulum sulfidophilum TaxID=35806 RepID=A0A0D6AY16_RHOSU|nr:DUF1150 family protein [Rhodovulum sulfidophilum]ANB33840.1 hypothetical protein A6W98_06960 [Rhodovulum sulfidophilum DSM 1374]ANB37662.1 hypothetical protein A6024_06815 [Rhodovulum sulfidophilum]MBK5922619.1 hypothetical protein [Rhodovulum sulfidophilum]MBL3553540.1 DUF1150 family protein [Rhodovulum sulfidophilum]MBL3562616.1 DUF1150 family protein [Rhodovulum sulfidophilum]
MNVKYDPLPDTGERIVYVRPVKVAELPEELRRQAPDLDELYAVHDSNGDRLALVRDRKLAFLLARQNDMAPVNVH